MPTTRATAASVRADSQSIPPGTSPLGVQPTIPEERVEELEEPPAGVQGEQELLQEETQNLGLRIRGAAAANRAQTGPIQDNSLSELEELCAWLKATEEQEELSALREIRRKYDPGDSATILSLQRGVPQARTAPAAPSSNLPRPDPPTTYQKLNRAEFNRWERDCEGFFLQSPANFRTEGQKVDFGLRYISESLKTLWQAHCSSKARDSLSWMPTWVDLKQVMLDALGTPAERRQAAYEALKRCRQRTGDSPTDLLDYLRPLWEELGEFHSPEMQVRKCWNSRQRSTTTYKGTFT
ncbi:hypothetical protein EJ07DRAFT_150119 [Lizonia empirigonia]|nr:hypothetical protein EJ07DRAFT_150119 [Lizonia empirigonia]